MDRREPGQTRPFPDGLHRSSHRHTRVRAQDEFVLTGLDVKIYLGCDTAQTSRSIARQLGDSFPQGKVRARLESFRDARLMAEMDGRYLSLAVWRNRAAQIAANTPVSKIAQESQSLPTVI